MGLVHAERVPAAQRIKRPFAGIYASALSTRSLGVHFNARKTAIYGGGGLSIAAMAVFLRLLQYIPLTPPLGWKAK